MGLIKTGRARSDLADDLALAHKVVAGEAAAVETLLAHYGDSLYAYIAHNVGGPPEDIEDLWQDTWLAALESLPGYAGRSRLFTWLCGIARHKIADLLRRRARDPAQAFSDLPSARLAELMDQTPVPDDVLESQAARLKVVGALARLPEQYRRALVVRYADQHSVAEVAQLLGKGCKAAESLLARARTAFRAALAEEDEEVRHE